MSKDLVLELYSEEIPALMQIPAAIAFKDIFTTNFRIAGVKFEFLDTYISPCRLIIHCTKIDDFAESKITERRGPKVSAHESAIKAFCNSCGKKLEELKIKKVKDADYYFDIAETLEQKVENILAEVIVKSIAEYVWPKSMHWSDYKISWVRPLKNIMCLIGNEVLSFEYGHLQSNDITFGHKFLFPDHQIKVKDSSDYFIQMDAYKVMYDQDMRKESILKQMEYKSQEIGVNINSDLKLLEEVTGLVEYPVVLIGKIDQKFMRIPHEILTCSMRQHQKYFTTRNSQDEFSHYFLFVSNMTAQSKDIDHNIIAGNERVLSARLSDAEFFYNEDLKITCEERYQKLSLVTFHAKLGNMKDKADRMVKFVNEISNEIVLDQREIEVAAKFCKTDLVSGVVGEFPELQGVMGGYYAKHGGIADEVSKAISEHYKPYGANDDLPMEKLSSYLSVVDKIDSLVGLYIAGERATGSKDPYGLRRCAIGFIRVTLDQGFSYNAKKLIEKSVEIYGGTKDHINEILNFIEERFRNYLLNEYEQKIVNSLISNSDSTRNWYNFVECYEKASALKDFIYNSQDITSLLRISKRLKNILKQNPMDLENASIIYDEKEQKLLDSANVILSKVMPYMTERKYQEYFNILSMIIEPLEEFFRDVNIITNDQESTKRKLALLSRIYYLGFNPYCDFEEL